VLVETRGSLLCGTKLCERGFLGPHSGSLSASYSAGMCRGSVPGVGPRWRFLLFSLGLVDGGATVR
jgi:hypothetical protein